MSEVQAALAQLAHDYSEGAVRHAYVPEDLRPMDEWDRFAERRLMEVTDDE